MAGQSAYIISIAIASSAISILIWAWFWTRNRDLNNWHAVIIFMGGIMIVLIALPIEKSIFLMSGSPTSLPLLVITSWAFLEEILKLSVILCAVKFLKIDRTKVLFYIIVAALGFAALENVFYIHNKLLSQNYYGLMSIFTRSLAATMMHFLTSGLIGIGLLRFIDENNRRKKTMILISSIITASAIHVVFNFFIIRENVLDVSVSIWALSIVLLGIIYRTNTKKFLTQIGIFTLIIALFLSGIAFVEMKLPKHKPEVLASWQENLRKIKFARDSFTDTGRNFTESIVAIDSIQSQLEQIITTMEKNDSLSKDQINFLSSYDKYVLRYNCLVEKQEKGDPTDSCNL